MAISSFAQMKETSPKGWSSSSGSRTWRLMFSHMTGRTTRGRGLHPAVQLSTYTTRSALSKRRVRTHGRWGQTGIERPPAPRNIFVRGDRLAIYDWGDSSVASRPATQRSCHVLEVVLSCHPVQVSNL
jgi:hypothetical protein